MRQIESQLACGASIGDLAIKLAADALILHAQSNYIENWNLDE